MVYNATLSINFVSFKQAMRAGTKAAGKAKAYYIAYMNNKVKVETFFDALKELDAEHQFIVKNDMDEVVCDLNAEIVSASRATYEEIAQ